jgi:hypothetical protein
MAIERAMADAVQAAQHLADLTNLNVELRMQDAGSPDWLALRVEQLVTGQQCLLCGNVH